MREILDKLREFPPISQEDYAEDYTGSFSVTETLSLPDYMFLGRTKTVYKCESIDEDFGDITREKITLTPIILKKYRKIIAFIVEHYYYCRSVRPEYGDTVITSETRKWIIGRKPYKFKFTKYLADLNDYSPFRPFAGRRFPDVVVNWKQAIGNLELFNELLNVYKSIKNNNSRNTRITTLEDLDDFVQKYEPYEDLTAQRIYSVKCNICGEAKDFRAVDSVRNFALNHERKHGKIDISVMVTRKIKVSP